MLITTIRNHDREALVAYAVTITGAVEWRVYRQGEPTKALKSRTAALRAASRFVSQGDKGEVF